MLRDRFTLLREWHEFKMINITAVGYEHEGLREKAKSIAEQLHFKLVQNADPCLFVTEEKLTLKYLDFPQFQQISALHFGIKENPREKARIDTCL